MVEMVDSVVCRSRANRTRTPEFSSRACIVSVCVRKSYSVEGESGDDAGHKLATLPISFAWGELLFGVAEFSRMFSFGGQLACQHLLSLLIYCRVASMGPTLNCGYPKTINSLCSTFCATGWASLRPKTVANHKHNAVVAPCSWTANLCWRVP